LKKIETYLKKTPPINLGLQAFRDNKYGSITKLIKKKVWKITVHFYGSPN